MTEKYPMFKSLPAVTIFFIGLIFVGVLHAKETDNITGRYKQLEDSTDILDQEMNRRLKELEEEANDQKISCNKIRDFRILFHELNGDRFFIGSMESWAEDEDKVAKRSTSAHDSVYEGVLNNGWIFNRLKLSSTIKVNGQLIGTDKLGHFLDQGFEFYTPYRTSGYDIDVAMRGSIGSERTYSGGSSTGTISYSDSVANYHGIHFYHNLAEGQHPYFTCSNGKWQQIRPFKFSEYVDAAWDEGINCSQISSADSKVRYEQNIAALEQKAQASGKDQKYKCPADINSCLAIVDRYATVSSFTVSPECKDAAKAYRQNLKNSGGSQNSKPKSGAAQPGRR
jgi:hypothetical protein